MKLLNLIVILLSAGTLSASEINHKLIVYKNATCGCCSKWAQHMRDNGFSVEEKAVNNLDEIKDSLGVPKEQRSCHTATLNNYVFEGHIPAQSIKKFLKNNQDKKGLVVPGMPTGSPGMEYGNIKTNYSVMSFDKNGKIATFEKF